ncbi:uncharacterized protein K452DRAFT_312037 [Aplosporella prunicola CBS 121167]|uniref:Uncharacterized protein n=1 Tax=Aplosporella prunicola CBS 121167 TaxID=1176127 RepID=A0A6A6B4L3_9PEZI|nr:uncharacterized protein K452DRAFT_312037 [Aplosporella prunicola CBS 121167]KAF2137907.1 hypothetical protein K452DRAFT_312037 [Aplosporella prunicola CBS 121167]
MSLAPKLELPDRSTFLQSGDFIVPATSAQINVADNICNHCWEPIDFLENETFKGTIVALRCCNNKYLYKVYHRQCLQDYFNQSVQGIYQNRCPNEDCHDHLYKATKAPKARRTSSFRGMIRSFSSSFGSSKSRDINPSSVSSVSRVPAAGAPSSMKSSSRIASAGPPPSMKNKKRVDSARPSSERTPVLICIIRTDDIASVLELAKRKGLVPDFVGNRLLREWENSLKDSLGPLKGKSKLVQDLKHDVYKTLDHILMREIHEFPNAWLGKGDDHKGWVGPLAQFIGISISVTMTERGPLEMPFRYWDTIPFTA